MPVYTDVTVNGTLLPQEWNPITETGGVIAIEATGTVTLNAGINANGVGYCGGALLSFSTCNFFTNPNSYYYSPATVIGNNNNGTYKGEGINNTISAKEGVKETNQMAGVAETITIQVGEVVVIMVRVELEVII